jgi:hypothetical protein
MPKETCTSMRRRHGLALVTVATVLATGLTASASASVSAGTGPVADAAAVTVAACGTDEILRPTCPGRALFGGWSKGYTTGTFQKVVGEADLRYRRRMDLVHMYHAPDGPAPVPFGDDKFGRGERQFTLDEGRIVVANYKPGVPGDQSYKPDFAATARGDHDEWIRVAARNIKAMGSHKVMLALQHEPENDIGGGTECTVKAGNRATNTPETYRAMWRRTRQVFDAEGVTNVVWVMNYMSLPRWDCLVTEVWPGDDLVDWVAYDPYSTDGGTTEVTRFAESLAAKTDASHGFVGKPYMLAEYGVIAKPTTREEAELGIEASREASRVKARAFYGNLEQLLGGQVIPNLKALVVFDSQTGTNGLNSGVGVDAWGAADPAEQEAFNRLAANPAFLPTTAN